ncbi:MAG: efflux RND transporter periplasmic adaptor subunit [Marinilabiliales bacterium]|nr:efflux RND transporter periplasmic adaptor subunit [Marinilabiliales bacterium]
MNKAKVFIVAGALILLVIFVVYAIKIISTPVPIEIQGEVEATQVKVASKLTARIDSLCVKKGDAVEPGTLLFTLISPELEAKMSQAAAVKQAAGAQRNKAYNGAQQEDIQAAFNNWQMAQAAAEYAKKTFARVQNLFREGVVPEQQKDEVETKMKAAIETEKAAHAIYEKARKGARPEDKEAAGALLLQAEGVVSEVSSYLNEKKINAPIKGEIANILAERGELIPAGYPVMSIVDLSDVWISFNLREDLLADIRKGSEIVAVIPALGKKSVRLKVSYINVLGDFATWNATKTRGDFDLKTFEVQAVPMEKVEGLRPGMSAIVNWDLVRKEKK